MRKHPGKALTNMVLSCVLCSIAVNWVALPNGFVVTGITGLSMAAAQFTGVNYALIRSSKLDFGKMYRETKHSPSYGVRFARVLNGVTKRNFV